MGTASGTALPLFPLLLNLAGGGRGEKGRVNGNAHSLGSETT